MKGRLVTRSTMAAAILIVTVAGADMLAQQPAGSTTTTTTRELSEELIKWIIGVTMGCITVCWLGIVIYVGWRNQLKLLVELVRSGPLIKFVTLTYIIISIVLLAVVGILQSDQVAALLGSIAGYILGQSTSPGRKVSLRPGGTLPGPSPGGPAGPTAPPPTVGGNLKGQEG